MLKVNETIAASTGLLTSKALDYIESLKRELQQPRLKAKRRAEIEEDLAKIAAGKFVEINGVKHFIMDEGPADGEAIILVHGWDCSSFWWHAITDKLNDNGYRTINYDLRGHGLSDENHPGNDNYSIKAYVEDLEALRQYFKLEKFHIATFSLGSVIAVSYAAKYPEHVASLTAFNFGLFRYNPIVVKVMPIALSTVFSRVLRPVGPKSWRFVYYYARLTLTKNPVDKRDILYGLLSLRDCSFRTSYNSARDIMSKPVLDELPLWCTAVKAPTLLVPGSHDRVIGKKNAKALANLIPNLTYFEMPKCGHLILAELPNQVVELMKMHLGKNSMRKDSEILAHTEN
ncbi:alpha/beta hydrolase [Candidatus Chlorohelix sp.]|uniref:alpha/beta fold hydrolase n=1 Tax=Candidatus Chlorohelix sp. TaxID=3139201 RepID=UPI003026EF7C